MTILGAIDARHSVRAYLDRPIAPEVRQELDAFTLECNKASGLHILFSVRDGEPFVRVRGIGPYHQVDLGIAACHFEAASGRAVRH